MAYKEELPDFSVYVMAEKAIDQSEELTEFKKCYSSEINKNTPNTNFKIQYISSIDKFYLASSSEFIRPDLNNPFILEPLIEEINEKTIEYSAYLRPLNDGLHLVLTISRLKTPHSTAGEVPSKKNTRIICDYLMPKSDLSCRFSHMRKLKELGWKCNNSGATEEENVFGEKYTSRRYYRDRKDGIVITIISKP